MKYRVYMGRDGKPYMTRDGKRMDLEHDLEAVREFCNLLNSLNPEIAGERRMLETITAHFPRMYN